MNSLVERIDSEVERRSLLKHPFYQMWSKGELTLEDLSIYSMEYYQLVKLIPELVGNIYEKTDDPHQREMIRMILKEEKEHIELWIRFASSLGVSQEELDSHPCLEDTGLALEKLKLATFSSFDEGAAALYSHELELPKISETKLRGMKEFYNLNDPDARIYFETHEVADVKHAAVWRNIVSKVKDSKYEEMLRASIKSLEAQNQLLDSVMKQMKTRN